MILTYNDGSTADIAYDQFRANGITANPANGTAMSVAAHNEQVITLSCNTYTATTDNLIVNAAPTYSIGLSKTGTYVFSTCTVGYISVAPITVTITRTGTGTITKLAATLSGTNADDFILGVLNATTLDSANTSAEFTIKPKDGLASGTYTATVTVTADNNVSQEFDISFTVNTLPTPEVSAPGVPTGVTATGGNAKVILSWNSAARSTGYKIFQSTIPDSYGTALTTVSGGVYSYEVTGLTNGVTYYFVIKATNEGGDSPDSKEVSATPINVPGVPTNVTATASNGQATVSFIPPADNGGSAITRYTVTSSPGDITAADLSTTITVKGLSNGVDYTFTVTASNAAGTSLASTASNAVTPYIPSGGAPDRDSTPSIPDSNTPPSNTGFDILVNGKTETAATATTTQEGDKTVTTVIVDDKKVEERLEQEGNNAVVTIPVNNSADIVIGNLNGQTVKNMEKKEAVLEIKTQQVTYSLPASQINIDSVSAQIGKQVELKDIAVSIQISDIAAETVKIIEDTAIKNNYKIMVKPIEFEIKCTHLNKIVEVSKFNTYVKRTIKLPEGIDPFSITTGIVLNSDGTFSHVPTVITLIDGKYYATINSLTDSTYSLIYSPKTFKDIENHWAKEAINDMASRLVVNGINGEIFEPDMYITRAEFMQIVVKALGLMRPDTGKDVFKDVIKGTWYYDAASIAYEYGFIFGYGDGKFGPNEKISREQAMLIISRVMEITSLKVDLSKDETHSLLEAFADADMLADYARNGIAACIKLGIILGRNGNFLASKDNLSRAEAVVIVRRLLQKANLI